MSKNSTGAIHHFTALKLNINTLVKRNTKGGVNFNKVTEWNINGTKTGSIRYDISLIENEMFIRLKYVHTDYEGKKHDIDYKINIVGVESNLGKGENLYFVCPITYQRCKILYQCYDSKYFISRKAYSNRIYYTSQMYSKVDRVNNYYFELNNRINEIESKNLKSHYRGKETQTQKLLSTLKTKRDYFDLSRINSFISRTDKFLK